MDHMGLIGEDDEFLYRCPGEHAKHRMGHFMHERPHIIEELHNLIIQIPPVQKIAEIAESADQDDYYPEVRVIHAFH
jgi:hypothetical protein